MFIIGSQIPVCLCNSILIFLKYVYVVSRTEKSCIGSCLQERDHLTVSHSILMHSVSRIDKNTVSSSQGMLQSHKTQTHKMHERLTPLELEEA